eukprot:PITA_28058
MGGASQVASKLDRFIISEDLLLTGPAMTVSIMPFGGSDHWPVQLEAAFMGTPRNIPFRFENAWLSHPKFTTKREAGQKLQEINEINLIDGFTEEQQKLTDSLQEEWQERCLQEEIFWRQKSRIEWTREGERNTKFFHKSTVAHKTHNIIIKLKDSQGMELISHNNMESVLVQQFLRITEEPLEDRSRFIDQFTQYIP